MADVELRGGADVRRRLGRLSEGIEDDLGGAYPEIAKLAANLTGRAAPMLTGRLRRSWRPRTTDGRAEWSSGLPYARIINRGSRRRGITGTHYIEAALRRLERDAGRIAERGAQKAIREAGLS